MLRITQPGSRAIVLSERETTPNDSLNPHAPDQTVNRLRLIHVCPDLAALDSLWLA